MAALVRRNGGSILFQWGRQDHLVPAWNAKRLDALTWLVHRLAPTDYGGRQHRTAGGDRHPAQPDGAVTGRGRSRSESISGETIVF
jgi:hypothetical protein